MKKIYVIKDLQLDEYKSFKEWHGNDKEKLKKDFADHIRNMNDDDRLDLTGFTPNDIFDVYEYEIQSIDDDEIKSIIEKQ